ncbi:C-terminal region of Pasteurella multocida toxin residues 569-1285 [Pseudomonas asturiensis]|uniref:C-terminal region of Pasteurella multocida toxin residues 569-1285 n=1 Tax=Pseudomonas asturiensis TaxID=1190415 RepID=A0A1M7LNI8_9PSED|nr:membrane-targeted effector domain-containing toxin [Pseudomonas asturiensis]SHM79643.1 C-terminal region of Pasteurella multocida toxin residues 569-1285 [Pseudomonas asturiensis]
MRPVGGPSSSYYPPMPEAEGPVTQKAENPSRSSHTSASQAPTALAEAPSLANITHYRARRFSEEDAEKVRAMLEKMAPSNSEGTAKHAGKIRSDAASSSHVHRSQIVASSSRATAAHSAVDFKANDLAELARWCESQHPFSLDPTKTAGKDNKLPANLVAELLGNGKAAIKKGLDAKGIKLEDVVIAESRKHLHINLNLQEMDYCLGRNKGLWMPDDQSKKLIDRANLYFEDFNAQDIPALAPITNLKSKESLGVMRELLRDSPGLIVGEGHGAISSKRELIKNFKSLKADGVNTLYMEHLCVESHSKALNEYLNSPKGSQMPARLKVYLDMQTAGNRSPDQAAPKYGFKKLLEAAKEAGMHVVPLDTTKTYATSGQADFKRIKAMNYYAAQTISLSKPEGKWIAFVGSTHATTFEGVPGLAQLQGVRSLIIDDHGTRSKPSLEINVKDYAGKLNPDATLSYKV